MDALTIVWIVVSLIFCVLFGMSMMKAIKKEEAKKKRDNN